MTPEEFCEAVSAMAADAPKGSYLCAWHHVRFPGGDSHYTIVGQYGGVPVQENAPVPTLAISLAREQIRVIRDLFAKNCCPACGQTKAA